MSSKKTKTTKMASCKTCNRTFLTQGSLLRHVRSTHPEPFQCQQSSNNPSTNEIVDFPVLVFKMDPAVTRESFQVSGIRSQSAKLTCNVCGKKFKTPGNVSRHLKLTHLKISKAKCDLCDKVLSDEHKLKRHVAKLHPDKNVPTVKSEKPLICDFCDKDFDEEIDRALHIVEDHADHVFSTGPEINKTVDSGQSKEDTDLSCTICDKKYTKAAYVKRHMAIKHFKSTLVECDICNKVFSDVYSLKKHMTKKHKGSQRKKCDFSDKKEMPQTLHVVENHSNQIFKQEVAQENRLAKGKKCDFCDQRYTSKGQLLYHMGEAHGREMPQQCDICEKVCTSDLALKSHVLEFHSKARQSKPKKKTFKSDICDKNRSLKKRVRMKNGKVLIKLSLSKMSLKNAKTCNCKCDLCDESFSCKSRLLFHMSKAHGQKHPYKCDKCEKVYTTRECVNNHLLKFHPNQSTKIRWLCENCDRNCSSRNNFLYHMSQRHGRVVPFKCDKCELAFKTTHSFYGHMKQRHYQNRPFSIPCLKRKLCNECDKTFVTDSDFMKHFAAVHGISGSLEEPEDWSCKGRTCCGAKFTVKEKFLYHLVRNHGEPGEACDDCEKAYTTERGLYYHKLRYHSRK